MATIRAPRAPRAIVEPPAPAPAVGTAAAALRLALAFTVGFAVLTGLGESALLGIARLYLHHLVHVSPQIVWMAPLTYAAAFALLALPFAIWGARRPDGRWLPWLVGVLTAIACYAILLQATGLYQSARIILALGVAVRLATLVGPRRALAQRLMPPAAVVLALIVALLGGGYNAWSALAERRTIAALPAARAGAPNILLLIWDTVRADALSLYGYPRETTPTLDRLARQGITFDQAIATAPWTLPSHAGMFTGRYPHELSAGWKTPLDGRWPTLAEALDQAGYATAGFVANTYYTSLETGLARGFAHYEDFRFAPGDFIMSTAIGRQLAYTSWARRLVGSAEIPGRISSEGIDARLGRWLDRRPAGRPFFAFLNTYDAHAPYLPPAPFDTLFRTPGVKRNPMGQLLWQGWKMTPQQVRAERGAYDAAIAYSDAQLGVLLQELRRRGLLDNTIVVIAADHGEEFGEHGVFTHGNSVYFSALHVPLVVLDPRERERGVRVAQPVSMRDLPATLLDLAGVSGHPLPGSSLAGLWRGASVPPPDPLLSEVGQASGVDPRYEVAAGDMSSVVTGGFHLIVGAHNHEQLFDLRSDPLERHDLLHGKH